MRRIIKAGEPAALQRYRRTAGEPGPGFDGMPRGVKVALRDALLSEQGWLCCYCMRRVDESGLRIEHHASQREHPERRLDYRNLFAACSGDLGGEPHCDVSKGSTPVEVDPLTVQAEWFGYGTDGRMATTRGDLAADLVTLGLNTRGLVSARRRALQQFLRTVAGRGKSGRSWSKKRLEQALARVLATRGDGRLTPFCEALAYWVRRRIERA